MISYVSSLFSLAATSIFAEAPKPITADSLGKDLGIVYKTAFNSDENRQSGVVEESRSWHHHSLGKFGKRD